MRNINEHGAASVEVAYAFLFLLAFAVVVQRFSVAGSRAHRSSIDLQNRAEQIAVNKDRPACIENIGEPALLDKVPVNLFGKKVLTNELVFWTQAGCEEK